MRKNLPPSIPIATLLLVAMMIAPLTNANAENIRRWLDEQTTVSVTAQRQAWTFVRHDPRAGSRVYNFADLGALEVNQAGSRHQYLCLLEWITDPSLRKSKFIEDFSTLTVWADDTQLNLPRYTQDRAMLHLTDMPFKKPTYNVIESYYEVTVEQLVAMSQAKSLRIEAANQPTDSTRYKSAYGEHASLVAFTNEVFNIAKQMKSVKK